MRYIARLPLYPSVFRKLIGCRLMSSDSNDEGFTRSIHCKPLVKEVVRDGKSVKIMTGLVDDSNETLGDQMTRLQLLLTYKHDLDVKQLHTWLQNRVKERNRLRQIVSPDSIQHMGLDLAVAHMICRVGGRVQFVGMDKWFFQYAGLPAGLPKTYVGDLKIQSIDFSGTNVVYEGFEYLPELTELRHLRLRRCVHVDDFCLSRVGRIESLQLLDVGECPRLTSKGLATLTQLKNLRKLYVNGNPDIEDKELVCLMLEDHLPQLYISGVDYIGQLPDGSRDKILNLVAGSSESDQTVLLNSSKQDDSDPKPKPDTSENSPEDAKNKFRATV